MVKIRWQQARNLSQVPAVRTKPALFPMDSPVDFGEVTWNGFNVSAIEKRCEQLFKDGRHFVLAHAAYPSGRAFGKPFPEPVSEPLVLFEYGETLLGYAVDLFAAPPPDSGGSP